MKTVQTALFLSLFFLSVSARAAVVPDYANNSYQNHELSRAEQKCLDEGYKITYANCTNQTAPADRCPHHDAYYRSCSQEQWCRNNNFRFLKTDCKLPLFPHKMCDNKFPLYRACIENTAKACEESGYTSKDKCQLSDKKCPFSSDYGICCDNCPNHSHQLDSVPAGYVAVGETCTTCDGIVKTNIKPAPCDGFVNCQYGPMSPQTPSCLQGNTVLYSACKTPETVCYENGFTMNSCAATEDAFDCPQNPSFKRCRINCLKQARADFPQADVFGEDAVDPVLDLTKKELRSLVGMTDKNCQKQKRPEITLHINQNNLEMYKNVFDRNIENIDFHIIYDEEISLPANGSLQNVRIRFSGAIPSCPLQGQKTEISGIVSFVGAPALCGNFNVAPESKMLSEGDVIGNIDLAKGAALGLKGNLKGYLKTQGYNDVFIKGRLEYQDPANNSPDSESIVFGCNSKVKIAGGVIADTSAVVLKQWAKLDTPSIKMTSTTDNPEVSNSLASVHLYKYAALFSTYDQTIFPLAENNDAQCDDLYFVHLGSAVDPARQNLTIEPSNRVEDKWQCRNLTLKQLECN